MSNRDALQSKADGGTVSDDINIAGVLRVMGQQAFYWSGSAQTISTNNATGGTTIGCGSSADVTVNGARMQIPSLLHHNSGYFQIGNSTNRFKRGGRSASLKH